LGQGLIDFRDWGTFQVLGENPVCVKILTVNPHSRLSLQTHEHRSEVWYALTDGLQAIIGDRLIDLKPLHRYGIGQGVEHRLINPTDKPLQVVELMYGVYDEADIFRIQDDYGR
jgi:mannose-6-phosphate isomerase-like protein (cupin superfamily)